MIFVDTSGLIAVMDEGDAFHQKALNFWKNLKENSLVSSNYVINETLGWIRYRLGKKKAVEAGSELIEGGEVRIIKATGMDERLGWGWFKKLNGRGVSMVDSISIAIMKKLRVKQIFTFDKDFLKAGLKVVP